MGELDFDWCTIFDSEIGDEEDSGKVVELVDDLLLLRADSFHSSTTLDLEVNAFRIDGQVLLIAGIENCPR